MENRENGAALLAAKSKNGKRVVLAWVLILFFGMALIGFTGKLADGEYVGTDLSAAGVSIALFALGVFLLVRAKREKKLIALFPEYAALLSGDREMSFARLAASRGEDVSVVTQNVEKMMSLGLFAGFYIDRAGGRLVRSERSIYDKNAPMTAAKCECCGGTTEIPENSVGTCEYCGAAIDSKGKRQS